jgi:hypothetical protein
VNIQASLIFQSPLYTISEDGVQVPLILTYHSVGIRVTQEASWVGLGWDLAIGSVVQTINDKDDYGIIEPSGQPFTKMKPDYYSQPIATEFPLKWNYPFLICQYGCNGPIGINNPADQHGYTIFTDYYAPVNGYYERYVQMFDDEYYDSEPDVFTANFLGHSIKFIRKNIPDQLIVLNKKGYSVQRINGNWKIIVPSGEEFYFEEKNISESYSVVDLVKGGTVSGPYEPSSITWLLTKIVTKNKKQITFSYTQTAVNEMFPAFSEKFIKTTLTATNQYSNYEPFPYFRGQLTTSGSTGHPVGGSKKTFAYTKEAGVYLSSISFPNGQINFVIDDRVDFTGGKKLAQLTVSSGAQSIKSFQFNYDYFDGSTVGGNGYSSPAGTISTHRLKLTSIQENSGATHTFFYNSTLLPKKNSFACDYWGYYNGQVSNTTMYANATQFNRPDIGNNGDNHSSNLSFAKGGILESMKYPTGGTVNLEYELNEFDNYWVPDFSSGSNSLSHGNGLRIKKIIFKEVESKISKTTRYTYFEGKSILPVQMIRSFGYTEVNINSFPNTIIERAYTIDEVNNSGFFSPSLCGSVSGVGYGKVIKEDIDENNQTNGLVETNFYNNPDIATNSANTSTRVSAVLPAFKNKNFPDNGSVQSVFYKDNQGAVIKKIETTYSNSLSQIFYGARIFAYGNFVYETGPPRQLITTSQNLIGYYPIFDFETLPQSSTVTDYANGNTLVTTTSYFYDYLNRPVSTTRTNSDGAVETETKTYPSYGAIAIQNTMMDRNRLLDEIAFYRHRNGNAVYRYTRDYAQFNDKILETKTTITEHVHPSQNKPTEIFYDQYDAGGNLLQYTKKNNSNSIIWDYNSNYVIAEVQNAVTSNVAYTSFESDGTGNWTLNGAAAADPTAITGKKSYSLDMSSNTAITRSGLSSTKTYIISYWSFGNYLINVNGTTATGITGRRYIGWGYCEHKIVNPPGGIITITGTSSSSKIDELRLYPEDALMVTSTYDPLIGMTSQCDANNRINYYDYDAFNRLVQVRDQDNNVVKKICYNYAGQPENCISCFNLFPIWQNTSSPLTCQQGSCGNTGYQLQEQIDINPCSQTFNQTQLIEAGYNLTVCPPSTNVNITYQNPLNLTGFTVVYTNTGTSQTYTFNIPTGNGTLGCVVPPATYFITISKPGNTTWLTFSCGCKVVDGTSASFGKTVVNNTQCNSITIDNLN